ncbi:hypothetical protein GCM10027597_01310 [Saccharopolyspora tripterygii]
MGRFRSKAQWRAMHARHGHRGWVKRWAKKGRGRYRSLPRYVVGSKYRGTGRMRRRGGRRRK